MPQNERPDHLFNDIPKVLTDDKIPSIFSTAFKASWIARNMEDFRAKYILDGGDYTVLDPNTDSYQNALTEFRKVLTSIDCMIRDPSKRVANPNFPDSNYIQHLSLKRYYSRKVKNAVDNLFQNSYDTNVAKVLDKDRKAFYIWCHNYKPQVIYIIDRVMG